MGPSSLPHFPSSSSIARDAAASASLSALLPLPPLPSPSPSHVILYLQQIEHRAAAVDLVRKRPVPDLYLPPQWHVMGDFSDVTAATGGSAVLQMMLLFPVAWPSRQQRRQSDQDLRTFLLRCSDDLDEAQSALQEIAKLATPFRTSTHRVSAYSAEAMSARLSAAASHLDMSRIAAAFQMLNAIRPFLKFSDFKAKQAIQEEFEGEDPGHVFHLHIMIMQGLELLGPIHRARVPRVRLTVLGASTEALEVTGKAGNLEPDKLSVGTRRRETVAVHWLPHPIYAAMVCKTLCLIERSCGTSYLDETDSYRVVVLGSSYFHEYPTNTGHYGNVLDEPTYFEDMIVSRYKISDQRETQHEKKWALQKQDGGEEEERQKDKTICDLDDKGGYELPEVWLGKKNMEKHKKKEKAKDHLFTALKVTGIRNYSRYFLLLLLFCTLATAVDSSSRNGSSRQGFCPKPDVMPFLLPAHETVCPVLDISSVHWTHSKRVGPQESEQRDITYICPTIVFLISLFACSGPWMSISNLEPVEGKVHKFLFFIRIKPVRMWYCTLAVSVSYYVSMIAHGVMLKSDQSCGIWVPNAIYCSIFLSLVAYLCYREKRTFQVNNVVHALTCSCCIIGAISIGVLHVVLVELRPEKFDQIFYFEKIALFWLVVMYVFRVFTMEHTPYNAFVNMLSALIPVSLLWCDEINDWHRYIVIGSSVGRTVECVAWVIWWMIGWNPLIAIEPVNP